jgi:hypothetical protein
MTGEMPGQCVACGNNSYGVQFMIWVRPTFVDFDKLHPGTILCDACRFCFEDGNEVLQNRLGRDKPQRMRNYSHFVLDGIWVPVSKGEKPRMIQLLRSQADVAVIADSGQKHIIFRAKLGWWQFEEQSIRPDWPHLESLIVNVGILLSVFSKSEIEHGSYSAQRIRQFGISAWRELEMTIIKPERGSALFLLALFLAQKGESDAPGRYGQRPPRSDLEGDRRRV